MSDQEQISLDALKRLFPHATKSTIARNSGVPSGVQNPKREPTPVSSLVSSPKICRSRKSRVGVVVSIIAFRRRYADDDNIGSGAKTLRDCIARTLRVDDGDPRIKWEYGTVHTIGPEHTLVKISLR